MAKYSNTIEYNIITKLNSSGISQLQTQLRQLELSMQKFSNQKLLSEKSVSEARIQLQGLSSALTKSFNPSLGMLDLTKFNTQLKESGVSAQGLTKAFSLGGAQGQVALNNLTAQIGKFNTGIERSSSTVDKMFNTIQNTFRWGLVSSAFSQFMNMIHQSVDYVKDLDSSLTQIMLVTDYSRAQMQDYAKSANEAAKALGSTTVEMTNANLVFSQMGYNLEDSDKLAQYSVKLANASQQDSATTSDQITAYMNAYGLDIHTGELNKALDSWAEVANVSAADVAELAGASQKAASSAKAMGVSTDQLNAQIATIESVTRGAPEEIGNGLKTLYARFSDIQMGETVEGDVDLGKVTGTLDKIGVQVLDKMGNMRNVGDIMEDLMGVWQTLDDNAKKSAATTLAGKHQVDRFLALMNNSDMYEQYKGSSENATGTLDKMNEEYVNSIEGKTKQFQAAVEGLLTELLNPDAIYPLIDTFKGFLEIVKELVKSLGGGQTVLAGIVALFTRMFSKNIAQTINDAQSNMQIANIQKANLVAQKESLEAIGAEDSPLMDLLKFGMEHGERMTPKSRENFNEVVDMQTKAENEYILAKQKLEDDVFSTSLLSGALLGVRDPIFKDDEYGDYTPININETLQAMGKGFGFNPEIMKELDDEQFKEMGMALESYGVQLQEVKKLEDAYFAPKATEKSKEENLERLKQQVEELRFSYENLNDITEGAAEGRNLEEIVNRVEKEIKTGQLTEETYEALDKMGLQTARVGSEYKEGIRTKTDAVATLRIEKDQADFSAKKNIRKSTQEVGRGYQESQVDTEQTENLIKMTSAVSELSFAWQSFQNLGSIWANTDLDVGEKLLQTITNLAFAIPTLVNGMKNLKQSVSAIDWDKPFFGDYGISKKDSISQQMQELSEKFDFSSYDDKKQRNLKAAKRNFEREAVDQDFYAIGQEEEAARKERLANQWKEKRDSFGEGSKKYNKYQRRYESNMAEAEEFRNNAETARSAAKYSRGKAAKYGTQIEEGNAIKQAQALHQNLGAELAKNEKSYANLTLRQKVFAKAAQGANTAISGVGKAFSGVLQILSNPVTGMIITAATAIFNAVQGAIQQAEEQTREAAYKAYEKAKSDYDETAPQVKEFDTLYETWKKTGEGADQLAAKGKELSKNLNILGGDALAASEDFITLKERIDEANQKKVDELVSKGKAKQKEIEKETSDSLGGAAELHAARDVAQTGMTAIEGSTIIRAATVRGMAEEISETRKDLQRARQRREDLEREGADSDSAEWKRASEEENKLSAALGGEKTSGWIAASEEMSKATLATSDFQKKIEECKGSVQALWNLFSTDPGVADYFNSLGTSAEKYNFIAQNVTDTHTQVQAMIESAKASSQGLSGGQLQDFRTNSTVGQSFSESIDSSNIEQQLKDQGAFVYDGFMNTIKDNITKQAIESLITQFGERSDLTDEQKQQILSGLDWGGSIQDIINTLAQANSKYGTDKVEELDTQQRTSRLSSKYNVGQETQDAFTEYTSQHDDDIIEKKKELADAYETAKNAEDEATKAHGEESKEAKDAAAATNKAKKAQDSYNDSIKDTTKMAMQTEKGLSELNKVWEENEDVLEDASKKGTLEYVEALGEVRDALADVLNVSSEDLSTDFIEEHLDEIGQVAEGDFSQLQDLRTEAAQDILLNMNISGESTLTPENLQFLQDKMNEINLSEISSYASIDDEEFKQKLNEMLANGEITATSLGKVMNAWGVDPEVEWSEPQRQKLFEIGGFHWEIPNTDFKIDVPGIPVWGEVRVPRIKNLNNGENNPGGGGLPGGGSSGGGGGRSGGGGGGRSGGGSGSSGKSYTPKHKDPIEEEIDLYEKVETQLDKVKGTLEGVEQETDRLVGPKAYANMQRQIKLIERENQLLQEKLSIQQKERDDLRNELNGYGITFDSEGFIANYADVLKSLEGRVNDLTNQYNANGTEEGQEQLDNEIEGAKDRLDKFKDLYKRYDELQGQEIQDTLNEIEELKDSIEDLRIEAYKAAQEALDELKEIRDSWTELEGFFSGHKLDSPFRNIGEDVGRLENVLALNKNKIARYYDEMIRKNQELANSAKDAEERQAALDYVEFFTNERAKALGRTAGEGGAGLLGLSVANLEQLTYWKKNNSTDTPFGENQAALVEALEDAYNRTKDLLLEAEENVQQLEEDIISKYDEIAEKMERHLTRYQRITDGLEHVADMISLTTGEEAYSELSAVYGQMAQTSLEQAKVQKSLVNWWQAALDGIKDKDSELYKAVEEHLHDAQDQLMEAQRATAENFQKEYENAVQKVLANMNKKILGVSNVDRVTDDWERDKDYASRYYDDVQKANQVEQLRIKYLNLLDDAQNASLDIQRKIRDSMGEQVSYLQDQAHLSEFNVRYANAQLEILQKQLALEDARNNKNQMRLRRDTQGNYKYVYAANQDDIRQKESDLLQSEMDAYNMSTENRMDVYSQWIAAYQQYQQRYAELQQLAASQNEQVAQEAKDALVKLEADFARDMKAYSEELNDSWEGMMGALSWMAETGTDTIKDSAEIAMDAIREKTDESLSAVGIQWNETIDGAIEDIDGLLDTAMKAWAEIDNATTTYATNIKTEVNSLIDEGFGNLSGCLTNAANETDALRDATKKLKQALDNDNQSLQNAQTELANYRDALADTKNAASVTANALRNAQSELDKTKMENLALQGKLDDIAAGYRDQWGNIIGGGEGGSQWNGDVEEAAWGIARNIWTYGSWGNDPDRHSRIAERFGEAVANRAQEVINGHWWTGELVDYGSDIWGYATGGYTGTWADGSKDTEGGKLALLHQKELVLNAQDTENVLQAVNLVRQMTDALKGSFEIGSMVQKGTQVNKLGQDTIEQRVEITAEFPNVHNSDDIRNALLDLSNSAFQYSYKEV